MKLIYFDIQARGESTRMALAHARAQYEDCRIKMEDWPAYKAEHANDLPNGQVPVWCQNGETFAESLAILRLVGKQFGYYPAEYEEQWQADALTDYANDFIGTFVTIVFFEKKHDEEGQQRYKEALEKMCAHLEKHLAHGKDFLVGDKLTIADFHVASVLFAHVFNDSYIAGAAFTDIGKAVVARHSKFAAYIERMRNQLSHYLATRPAAPL